MKQNVVIIGHGYTSRLGIIRSLAEIGCNITVIVIVFHNAIGRLLRFDGGRPIDCCSKYVKKFYYCRSGSEEELIHLLTTKCVDKLKKSVIIPDSDFSAVVVDKHQKELERFFWFPHIHNKQGEVEYWMDKMRQKDLAKSLGIPVAEGRLTHVSSESIPIPTNVNYPCFTKPKVTIKGGKHFLRKCEDEIALRQLLIEMGQSFDADVLIEDYKQIDEEYAVVGFSDGVNVVIPAVIQFISNSQSHFGIAREGIVKPICGFENLIDSFADMMRRIGFFGLFDIDFYKSGEVIYFGEINLRFGGSGYAVTKMGVNLPALFVSSIQGASISGYQMEVKEPSTFVNERMCIDDWSFYYLTEYEMERMIDSANIHFVGDSNDPGPLRKLMRYKFGQKFKRILRRVLVHCFT